MLNPSYCCSRNLLQGQEDRVETLGKAGGDTPTNLRRSLRDRRRGDGGGRTPGTGLRQESASFHNGSSAEVVAVLSVNARHATAFIDDKANRWGMAGSFVLADQSRGHRAKGNDPGANPPQLANFRPDYHGLTRSGQRGEGVVATRRPCCLGKRLFYLDRARSTRARSRIVPGLAKFLTRWRGQGGGFRQECRRAAWQPGRPRIATAGKALSRQAAWRCSF